MVKQRVTILAQVSPSPQTVHVWLLGQFITMVIEVTHVCMNCLGVHGRSWVGI